MGTRFIPKCLSPSSSSSFLGLLHLYRLTANLTAVLHKSHSLGSHHPAHEMGGCNNNFNFVSPARAVLACTAIKCWKLSWDAYPDPGGGRHGRGRGRSGTGTVDPSSRARYICRNTNIRSIYTNFPAVTYPVFGVCTLAVQRWSIRKVCRRSRVRTWFAPFLNPDLDWYIPAHTSTYQYNSVHTGMYS